MRAPASDGDLAVIGVVSLAFWALMVVVTFKYVFFLMRADNKGEGGTLSLMALAQFAVGRRSAWIFFLGVCGAALFYGDGIITPAISVLSAVEGLQDAPGSGRAAGRLHRADLGRHPDRPVPGPVTRHRQPGQIFRPDHRRLVPEPGGAGPVSHLRRRQRSCGPCRPTTASCFCSTTASWAS
jgi:hypothetical protein